MQLSTSSIRFRLLTGLLTCCLAGPALAQQGNQNQNRRDPDQDQNQNRQPSDQQDRQQRQRQADDQGRQSDRQQERRAQLRAQPEGWVRMAVDYDRDGRFDGIETIYVYDLQVAQKRSQQRKQAEQRQGQRQAGMRRGQKSNQSSRQTHQVQGEIRDMQNIRMHDGEDRYLVARVRTNQGRTAKVLMGRQDQLSQLNLSDGDRVQVQGRVGRLNDRPILVASRVSSGDQQVRVEPKKMSRSLKHVQGEVLRTRTAKFRGHDDPYMLAEVRTDEGQRQLVNLGPKSKLDDVDLKQGKQVRMLAASGKVNGQEALIAEQLNVDGKTVKVKPQKRRDRQWSKQQDRQQRDRQQRDRQQRDRQQRDR